MSAPRPAIVALLALPAAAVSAHPVHEVVQNAYLTLAPGTVALQLELTAGPKVAGRIIAALDPDRDRTITPAEAQAYARRVLGESHLAVDGRAAMLRLVSIDVPSYAALRGAHGTIRITATVARPDRVGTGILVYRNGYSPSESRCDANIFLKPASGIHYRVTAQQRGRDGRTLRVGYAISRG